MNKFNLTITSPDGNVFSGEAIYLRLRGTEGELAVMAGHAPFVTGIVPCEVKIELESGVKLGSVDGGLLSVAKESVTLASGSFKWEK